MSEDPSLRFLSRPASSNGVVVFLDGLDGSRPDSWGHAHAAETFPHRLQGELPAVAVACYDYPSGLGRSTRRARDLATLADQWLSALRHHLVPEFERIGIVGYCLGGMLTRFALPLLHGAEASLRQVPLMVHALDTPEDWPNGPLTPPMAAIARILELDEASLRSNAAWWSHDAPSWGRLEEHAVVSLRDSWVTPFQPGSTSPPRTRPQLRRRACRPRSGPAVRALPGVRLRGRPAAPALRDPR